MLKNHFFLIHRTKDWNEIFILHGFFHLSQSGEFETALKSEGSSNLVSQE